MIWYAILQPDGKLVGDDHEYGPELWRDRGRPDELVQEHSDLFAGCSVVRVEVVQVKP